MCDYNRLSQQTATSLPVPAERVKEVLSAPAHNALVRAVRSGGRGRDLFDGRKLPAASMRRGHYSSPEQYRRFVARTQCQPRKCQWCGRPLPARLVALHNQPHDPREDISHHFHGGCWKARCLAIAVIFGHLGGERLLPKRRAASRRKWSGTVVVQKTVTRVVIRKPRRGRRRSS